MKTSKHGFLFTFILASFVLYANPNDKVDSIPAYVSYNAFQQIDDYDNRGTPFFRWLAFRDIKTGEIFKRIGIQESNPFKRLDWPVLSGDQSVFVYDVSNISEQDSIQYFAHLKVNANVRDHCFTIARVGENYSVQNDKLYVIAYPIVIGNRRRFPEYVAAAIHIDIYNRKGELIRTIEEYEYGGNELEISKDSKYLAIKYGSAYSPETAFVNEGYRFYDIQSGNLVFEFHIDKDFLEKHNYKSGLEVGARATALMAIDDSKFVFSLELDGREDYYVIDLQARSYCVIPLTYEQSKRMNWTFTAQYLEIKDLGKRLFYKDFEQKEF